MSKNWFDKKNKFKAVEKTFKTYSAPIADVPPAPVLEEEVQKATWDLKLAELQTFAVGGVKSGAEGGVRIDQHDMAILGIMSEIGQYAREMRLKPREDMKPNLARKRIGAMLVYCAELAIENGVTLDSAAVERINELCVNEKYQRPPSLA